MKKMSLGSLILSGCSLLPSPGEEAVSYDLPIVSQKIKQEHSARTPLRLEKPLGGSLYKTQRIVTKSITQEVNYLSGIQWAAPFEDLLQTSIAQSLNNSMVAFVHLPQEGTHVKLGLTVHVIDFYIELDSNHQPIKSIVTLEAQLASYPKREVFKTKKFSSEALVTSKTLESCMVSLQSAYQNALLELIKWTKKD